MHVGRDDQKETRGVKEICDEFIPIVGTYSKGNQEQEWSDLSSRDDRVIDKLFDLATKCWRLATATDSTPNTGQQQRHPVVHGSHLKSLDKWGAVAKLLRTGLQTRARKSNELVGTKALNVTWSRRDCDNVYSAYAFIFTDGVHVSQPWTPCTLKMWNLCRQFGELERRTPLFWRIFKQNLATKSPKLATKKDTNTGSIARPWRYIYRKPGLLGLNRRSGDW